MGMSTNVIGFRPPDDQWKKMKAIWDSCKEAGIDPPEEVEDFFESDPDEKGIEIKLSALSDDSHECCTEWSNANAEGYEVEVSKIPKNITHIRFYNSW